MSYVHRPSSRSLGFRCFDMNAPAALSASAKYGAVQPPKAKFDLVSSSGLPGACMTPSRVRNSWTMTLLMAHSVSECAARWSLELRIGVWLRPRTRRTATVLQIRRDAGSLGIEFCWQRLQAQGEVPEACFGVPGDVRECV